MMGKLGYKGSQKDFIWTDQCIMVMVIIQEHKRKGRIR